MSADRDLADPNAQDGEQLDRALRPQTFDDYVGQAKAKVESESLC